MRALSLSVVLERRAGEAAAAAAAGPYLGVYADTPHAGPLVRERADCAEVVAAYFESASDSPGKETARSLLTAMERADGPRAPVLSEREREVLDRLEMACAITSASCSPSWERATGQRRCAARGRWGWFPAIFEQSPLWKICGGASPESASTQRGGRQAAASPRIGPVFFHARRCKN